MKPIRAIALLLGAFVASPLLAADEWATGMATGLRTPCFDQVAPIAARDIVWRDLHSFAEGVGIANKLGPNWKPGDRHYDAAPSNRLGIDGLVVVQKLGRDIGGTLPAVLDMVREFQEAAPAGS